MIVELFPGHLVVFRGEKHGHMSLHYHIFYSRNPSSFYFILLFFGTDVYWQFYEMVEAFTFIDTLLFRVFLSNCRSVWEQDKD